MRRAPAFAPKYRSIDRAAAARRLTGCGHFGNVLARADSSAKISAMPGVFIATVKGLTAAAKVTATGLRCSFQSIDRYSSLKT